MTITVNTKAYSLDASVDQNQNRYTGPNHTITANDLLSLRRTRSAASGTNPGYARSFAKFTRTVVIGGVSYEAICEAQIVIPIGMTKSDVDSLRDDLGDLLVSTNGDDLVWKHDINQ